MTRPADLTDVDLLGLAAGAARRLDPDGTGGRHATGTLANHLAEVASHVRTTELAPLTRAVIEAGADAGLWEPARRVTVTVGAFQLPKHVTLPARAPSNGWRPVDVPLRPELAWAVGLPLSSSQRELVLAASDWLRDTNGGTDAPVIPAAERAYQLLGNEKAFDGDPPRGGTTLWTDGRLTFDLLRCRRHPTPLTWEPVGGVIDGPVLGMENHATFRTALRWLRTAETPAWVAVCWITGRNVSPLASLSLLPFTPTRFDYLGDLDLAGLQIARQACDTAAGCGIQAGPAGELWELLLHQRSRPVDADIDHDQVAAACGWLPHTLQARAAEVLLAHRRIPQEALRIDVLLTI